MTADYQKLQAEITEARERLERAQAELDELKNQTPDVCWMPAKHEVYFFANGGGVQRIVNGHNNRWTVARATQHPLRQTREEAEHDLTREQARMTIVRFIAQENARQGWVADWENTDQIKYFFYYAFSDELLRTHARGIMYLPAELYGSKATIKALIKECPDECKLYLGVDDA